MKIFLPTSEGIVHAFLNSCPDFCCDRTFGLLPKFPESKMVTLIVYAHVVGFLGAQCRRGFIYRLRITLYNYRFCETVDIVG